MKKYIIGAAMVFLAVSVLSVFFYFITQNNNPLRESGLGYDIHAWDINGGYRFIPSTNGKITQLGLRCDSGTRPVRLYDYATGNVLATANVTADKNKWVYENITPVNVIAGQSYVVATRSGSNNHCRSLLNLPLDISGVTIKEDVWTVSSDLMPLQVGTTMDGLADITFVSTKN